MALASEIEAADRGATKPAPRAVFARSIDHVVDATPAQWATFTVDVITYARRAQWTRGQLREVLAMLGIAGDRPGRRSFEGKAIPARGRCSGCHTNQTLRADGTVRSHKRGGQYCPGRYKPTIEPVAVAS